MLGLGVFAASWLGIQTRFAFGLASVWIANGLLLGTLMRLPRLNTPLAAALCALAYVLADLTTGSDLNTTLALSACNMAGVYSALLAYRFVPQAMQKMTHPLSAFYLLGVIGIEALAASILGGPLVGGNTVSRVFGLQPLSGFELFLFSEFSFTAIVLPVALFFGDWHMAEDSQRLDRLERVFGLVPPLLCLGVSLFVAVRLGGIGAIAIPLPALVWCAVVLPPFQSACLNAMTACWMLWALPIGLVPTGLDLSSVGSVASIRLGASTLAIVPLAMIVLNRSWMHIRERLEHAAFTDALTGLLNRGTMTDRANSIMEASRPGTWNAVLLLDIDHFKRINDTFGHGVGDIVLRKLARIMRNALGREALIGRFGGEEFVILLPGYDGGRAMSAAEALRQAVANGLTIADKPDPVTVSIGVAARADGTSFEAMLVIADRGLYAGKAAGRNKCLSGDMGQATGTAA